MFIKLKNVFINYQMQMRNKLEDPIFLLANDKENKSKISTGKREGTWTVTPLLSSSASFFYPR